MNKLRNFANEAKLGIEIAPFLRPIVCKSDGYNVLTMDIFNTETLRDRARNKLNMNENSLKNIEDVDIVANAEV